jgi:nicotinamidase-related amidase
MKHTDLNETDTILLITDVQLKLFNSMYCNEELKNNLVKLVKAFKILHFPVVFLEQNPKGLGRTIKELADIDKSSKIFEKMSFGVKGLDLFFEYLTDKSIKNIFLCGIEAHVCVMQTGRDLIRSGYNVHLITDAVSSRKKHDLDTGTERLKQEKAVVSSTETAIFEILKRCDKKEFKQILELVK